MLTKLIAELYVWIIVISLWFILLISAVAGFLTTVQALTNLPGGFLKTKWRGRSSALSCCP